MCGIAGIWTEGGSQPAPQMLDALRRRGPDAQGESAEIDGPWLGHTRLKIIDLSDAGAQPMESPSGRFLLTFNGEFYEHEELRGNLAGPWRGTSDTETIAAACEKFGVPEALRKTRGMLAVGVWDRDDRTLWLARDRFGKKPLLWSELPNGMAFASTLDALRLVPGIRAEPDLVSVRAMLERMSVPDSRSIWVGTHKVQPGELLRFEAPRRPPQSTRLHDVTATAVAARAAAGDAPTVDEVERVLRQAVHARLIGDVPLGSFLSGGMDSSLVTAMMTEVSDAVRTFTIGFEETAFDEAQHARAVAEHLGTDHHETYLDPDSAIQVATEMAGVYDEPFADSSQVPTVLLCRTARPHVTVALAGDGGDEVFGGYERYLQEGRLRRLRHVLPGPLRHAAASLLRAVPAVAWERAGGRINARRAARVAAVLASAPEATYAPLLTAWPDASDAMVDPASPLVPRPSTHVDSPLAAMMLTDIDHYLRDDILVKVDRAAMSVGLEVRSPFLDPKLFELAWRLPDRLKVRRGRGKLMVRKLLARRIPTDLWDRPKQGFSMPVAEWLRGPLRSWASDLLDPAAMRRQGLLRPDVVRRFWSQHQSGRHDRGDALWNVLMLQAWLERRS